MNGFHVGNLLQFLVSQPTRESGRLREILWEYGTQEAELGQSTRFAAHLSHQQLRTLVDAFKRWLKDISLWTIYDGWNIEKELGST
jgi:hypothetical protein